MSALMLETRERRQADDAFDRSRSGTVGNSDGPGQGLTTDVIQALQQKMDEEPDGSLAYMVYDMLQAGLTNDAIRQTVALAISDGYLPAAALTDPFLDELADTMAELSADAPQDHNEVSDDGQGNTLYSVE